MNEAISKTTTDKATALVTTVKQTQDTLLEYTSNEEIAAAIEMDTAKRLYNEALEDDQNRNKALAEWYWSWRTQLDITSSPRSALFVLMNALSLTSELKRYMGSDTLNDAALDYMEKFWVIQLELDKFDNPGLLSLIKPIDTPEKAAIMYRIYPLLGEESNNVLILWQAMTRK